MNAEVKLFNTLSRKIEPFEPIRSGAVKLYCCGPTVYNYQHIGNLRTYVFEDLLVRTLRYAGFAVEHVMNITDVGHLVSDADAGEDKMLLAARREGKKSEEIAEFYTQIFFEHCAWLNIRRPDVVCKATEHIPQMIELIRRIEQNGLAYQAGGNVYFDVSKFPQYGELAKLDLSELQAGARIEVDGNKRNPLDFVLWFTKSKFENQELQWDSPWGRGYPGWHIECSAMSMHYLGEHFDIHCGGIDHIPVHHTNEIAQNEGACCKAGAWSRTVNVWMHGGFLVVDKNKMSKSTGEFLTLDKVRERGIDPLAYRLFCLSGTYRNELSWSWEALDGAARTLERLKQQVLTLKAAGSAASGNFSPAAETARAEFKAAVFNDLAMPKALAVLHGLLANAEISAAEKLALALEFDGIFGLGMADWQAEAVEISPAVSALLEARAAARAAKNWAESDRLRDEIKDLGFVVEDSTGGQKVKKV